MVSLAGYKHGGGRTKDPFLEIAKGLVPGTSGVNKFGYNASVGVDGATVWDVGGLYPWSVWDVGAMMLTVESTDLNDTLLGTGARTIYITGQDIDNNEVSEVVEMDGLNQVVTDISYKRLYRMSVMTAGSSGKAGGNILVKNGITTVAQINNGNNQTLMALYTVPAGKTGYIVYGKSSTGKGKDVVGDFYVRPEGGVFNLAHRFFTYENSYDYPFRVPVKIAEKSDIELRGQTTLGTVEMTGVFDIVLVDNV